MQDATIDPVGAYDPVSRLPEGGGQSRQQPGARKPQRRPQPAMPQPPAADPGAARKPDADGPRGRHIDEHA